MADRLLPIQNVPVWVCDAEGSPVGDERAATDLIGEAFGAEASWVLVPAARLAPEFFRLASGVAGSILGKFSGYRVGLIVLGDIAEHVDGSGPLRDLVRESNRGRQAWFLPDMVEVERRMGLIGSATAWNTGR